MRDFEGRGFGHEPGHGRGDRRGGGGGRHKEHRHRHHGAQTFRRGRALEFLERLHVKSEALKQQLESPQLQVIRPILLGELKAVELIVEEFIQHFELREAGEESGPEDDADPDANADEGPDANADEGPDAETNEEKA